MGDYSTEVADRLRGFLCFEARPHEQRVFYGMIAAEGAVSSEPFSGANSLISRELTGNFREIGHSGAG